MAQNRTQSELKKSIPRVIKIFFFSLYLFQTAVVPRLEENEFQLHLSRLPVRPTMKSEIVVELLKIMLRKFIKTKIIVCQNVNFVFNLLNSYDGSRRRRDRSKRSHNRQSPEPDSKQQRRHRKPLNQHHNAEKNEIVRVKVSF